MAFHQVKAGEAAVRFSQPGASPQYFFPSPGQIHSTRGSPFGVLSVLFPQTYCATPPKSSLPETLKTLTSLTRKGFAAEASDGTLVHALVDERAVGPLGWWRWRRGGWIGPLGVVSPLTFNPLGSRIRCGGRAERGGGLSEREGHGHVQFGNLVHIKVC